MREREIVKDLVADILNTLNYSNWSAFIVSNVDKLPDSKVLDIYKRIKEVR